MFTDPLEERRKALEEAFFRKENERLLAALREERARRAAREALARECGLRDEALLDRLIALGIRADTVPALILAPLAWVAWADGAMDPRERDAVLRGGEANGIPPGSASHALLEAWTSRRPDPELMDAWRAYVGALCRELSAEQRAALATHLLGRARAVAEAAGGLLGVARVSKPEEAVLEELAGAFRA